MNFEKTNGWGRSNNKDVKEYKESWIDKVR